jgi:hypothetical protein
VAKWPVGGDIPTVEEVRDVMSMMDAILTKEMGGEDNDIACLISDLDPDKMVIVTEDMLADIIGHLTIDVGNPKGLVRVEVGEYAEHYLELGLPVPALMAEDIWRAVRARQS